MNELRPCTKSYCWIPKLLEKGYFALWPTVYWATKERRANYYIWDFYVRWTETRGTKANKKTLCEKHHKQILKMWGDEYKGDLREQEATEAWLTRVNSQMLTECSR